MADQAGQETRMAYLPPRAARARKLILRSQLGLPWLLAALAVAAVIGVTGTLFLVRAGRPAAPWVRVGAAEAFPPERVHEAPGEPGQVVIVDRRQGRLRAFLGPAGACRIQAAGDGFARACERRRWDAAGRSPTGGQQLEPVPAQLVRDGLYVDPTRRAGG